GQEPGDVRFGGMKWNAAPGDRFAALAIAGGQGDLQCLGGDQGVFVKKLVEVAQAKQQERVRVALLDRLILPHQRRRGFYHSCRARRARRAGREYTSRRALGEQKRSEEIPRRSWGESTHGN